MSTKKETPLRVGEILVRGSGLKWKQLETALEIQEETGAILGKILVEKGFVSRHDLYKALAVQFRMPFVDFHDVVISGEALRLVPKDVVYVHRFMPLGKKEGFFLIAVSDPKNVRAEEEVRKVIQGTEIARALACPEDIDQALLQYYGPLS